MCEQRLNGELTRISTPRDLDELSQAELHRLAQDIRQVLIRDIRQAGGHLGPNTGVVELTIALHRVFDSPDDPVLFDVGHQSYVHKMLTGRQDISTIRQQGGLSGYPRRAESEHDVVESSHAGSALSWGVGLAQSFALSNQPGRTVVVVLGDGSLTAGTTWEALNNIDSQLDNLVVMLNDNGVSYAPT
ncbi:MAG: 1-deoxy-D-xylulose-5-phosphate synthase, partial [Micrococcus sp.]|nr:1-deoxy-D-xylulose-5-phosphate synthase [Micrococcus sp.]